MIGVASVVSVTGLSVGEGGVGGVGDTPGESSDGVNVRSSRA
jgi:hypothetical protein